MLKPLLQVSCVAAVIAASGVIVACEEEKKDPVKELGKVTDDAAKKMNEAGKAAGDAAKKAGEAIKTEADKAKAALEEEAKKAGDAFEKQLKDFGSMLEGITTKAQAEAKKADISKAVDAVNAAAAASQKMGADAKTAFETRMAPVIKKVKDEIARLTTNKDTGSTLAEPLGRINLSK